MVYTWVSDFINTLLYSFSNGYDFLTSELIDLGGVSLTPLMLLTFGGLTAYITIAIVNWFIK